jgi:tetratricopeptide (TPR) repeat protein
MLEIFMHFARQSAKFEARRMQIEMQKRELTANGKERLSMAVEFGSESDEATALNELGTIYAYTGDYDIASTYFLKAAILAKQIEYKAARFVSLTNLGTVKKVMLDFENAERYYLEAFSIAKELKDEEKINNLSLLFDDLEYMKRMNEF